MISKTAKFCLKPAEIKKLIFHCQDLRERIIVRLMAHCGLRREEVSRIGVERIDWERNRIAFIGKMHKKHQSVPVPPDLMQDIKFFLAGRGTGPLFPAKKRVGSLTAVQINRIVAEIGKRAGISSPNPRSKTGNINPHLLRHTYARLCKDAGLTIEEVQGLMRHASFKTTYDLYGTLNFEEVQKRYEEKFLPKI